MAILTFPKGSEEKVSANFKAREFDCPCRDCEVTPIDEALIERLQRLRGLLKSPIMVTSAYRCAEYQEDLASRGFETAKKSMHLEGRAVDLSTGKHSGMQLEAAARKAGFLAVGIGMFWAHVDTRDDKTRRWFYKR